MVRASSFAKAVGLGTLLLVNLPSHAFGQSINVTGRVVDARDLTPLVAATVAIRGDTATPTVDMATLAVTDSAGRYSIAIPRPDVKLVFSYLGYAEQEVAPQGRVVLNVTLTPRPFLQRDPGTLPCDGAALPGPQALEPQAEPRRLPVPEHPSAPIPNACAVPTPGSTAAR